MTKKIVETTEIEESVIFITDEKIKKKFFFFSMKVIYQSWKLSWPPRKKELIR